MVEIQTQIPVHMEPTFWLEEKHLENALACAGPVPSLGHRYNMEHVLEAFVSHACKLTDCPHRAVVALQ